MAQIIYKGGYRVLSTSFGTKVSLLSASALIPRLLSTSKLFLSDMAPDAGTKGNWKYLIVQEVKPFVYNVQLNRPKKMNALSKELWGYVLQDIT